MDTRHRTVSRMFPPRHGRELETQRPKTKIVGGAASPRDMSGLLLCAVCSEPKRLQTQGS